ncbi:MAG TPA: ABC transporter ATP-binding protein [archaeon]|nr:ABC transporter ATP-binding protein [archaeon]
MRLSISNLSKQYRGNLRALRSLSLEVGSGILGLLGPNGAGKSTLMRILATVTKATEGTVTWNGTDISKSPDTVRSVLGYLPQDFGVYPNLNAVEFLQYMAAAKGLNGRQVRRRIEDLLQVVNLNDSRKRPLGQFSGGMKQRIGIAQALLNDPQLLIVDEPTAGLDPEERIRFRHLLSELSGERIIILSTHIVSDVESTANKIAIIDKGRLLAYEYYEALLQAVESKVWKCTVSSAQLPEARQRLIISNSVRRGDLINIRVVADTSPAPDAMQVPATLEDAYIYHISNGRQEFGA